MALCEKLKEQFGITELTPEALDRFTLREFSGENKLLEALEEFDPVELDKAGILLWADNRTCFSDQHTRLVDGLKAHFGEDYEHYLVARRILCAADTTRSLDSLNQLFEYLKANDMQIRDSEEFATNFGVCKNFTEVMRKFETHNKLTNNRLNDFYQNQRVHLFTVKGYPVMGSRGFYEHLGGFCLSLDDALSDLVYVGGWMHDKTQVESIHCAKPPEDGSTEAIERIARFTEATGIHPANLTLLMYMKLGERLRHADVKIRGSASPKHNRQGKESKLYMIPRNYFRLRVNPQSGYYEFGAAKRDQLLDEFSGKFDVVNQAFREIDNYMFNGTPSSL